MRRTIAFLLVLAECFSLAAVGAPAAYAQGDGQPYEIIEQTDTAEEVTPLEAALIGAQSAGEFADQAAQAADEAAQAALGAQQAESADAAQYYAQMAKQAAERAQALAARARDEADWVAGAASIAQDEADNAYAFALDRRAEADNAVQYAERTAEAAKQLESFAQLLEEELGLEPEKEAPETSAEPVEELEKDQKKDKADIEANKTENQNTNKSDNTVKETEKAQENSTELEAIREEIETVIEGASREEEEETLARAREEANRARNEAKLAQENADFLNEELARFEADAMQAAQNAQRATEVVEIARAQAERAATEAERAAASWTQAEAYAAAIREYAAAQLIDEEKPVEEEKLIDEEKPVEEEKPAEEEKPVEEEKLTEEEKPAEEQTVADDELPEEAGYDTYQNAEGTISVSGHTPAAITVETRKVTEQYADFVPDNTGEQQHLSDDSAFDSAWSTLRREVLAAYDITLQLDGEEYQPEAGAPLEVRITDPAIREGMKLELWHIHNDGAPEQITDFTVEGNSIRFMAESFSVYVVCTYTVDFHWGDYIYNMEGEGEITLSALLDKLGVTEITAADVADVSFTNPDYIAIEQTGSDWLLRSLAPFNTEEALTLTLHNGKSVEITVTDANDDPEITPPTAKEGLVYTGEAQVLVTAGSAEGGTMKYRLGDEGEYSTDLPAATASGEYTIYYKVEGDETHNSLGAQDLTVTIAKAPVTVTANNADKTYGDLEPELTATVEGLIGDDIITYTLSRAEGEAAGEYAISVSGDTEQVNYVVHYVPGVFTVAPRELTITAANDSKVYDGYVLSSEEFTVEGLVEGHAVQSVVHEGGLTDVGTYPHAIRDAVIVNPAVVDTEGNPQIVTGNYDIHYISGTLEVTKKPITFTAASAEKVYDGIALKDEGYTSTGLADGDVLDGMTVTGSQTKVGESNNVPSEAKIVRPTEDGQVVDVNDNYTITYANGTLKVTQRELTVTAASAEKVYDGTALTKESYTVEGLAEGDSVESVTVTGSQTDAGESGNVPSQAKVVNASGEDVSENYNIKYENGSLTVTKKGVKLTAKSGVEVYDGSEKTISGFAVSADGRLLNGITFADTVSASGSDVAVGEYPVTFSGVTLNETTDTTGNYIVTETENGVLRIAESAPIKKALTGFNGNEASYTININPDGLKLNGGQNLTLKDTFTNKQSINYSSINVNVGGVLYDYSQQTGTYTIPDETAVTITYKTRVSGEAGDVVTFGNTAQLGVMQNGGFVPWSSDTVSETRTITPTGTDIEGTDGNYMIRLFTYAQNHMEDGLGGAVYRLLDSNQRPISYRAGEHQGEIITFTTGDNGYVDVAVDDGIISLRKNTIYYLEMITAPVERNEDGTYTYYQKDNTLYSFLITDNPSYSTSGGLYYYFNGDVLKVRCYPESAGVNVTKRFSGNYTLTDAQKNQIRFILQKEDLATESWVDVESHTYAEFSYGSMNFNAGRAGGPPLEPAVLYRLIEENAIIEEADCTSAVILNYQRDNQPIQENTNEFEVNPDHSTYSFSLVFDNTYVDHKLTVVKLNELTGVLLPGAEFTVYKALDNTPVKIYPTKGEGVLEIRRNDEGANYAPNTAYYVVETAPPEDYLMPKNPERIYFYFSEGGSGVPEGIPVGMTAVDLTSSFDAIVVNNNTETVKVPVTVTWSVDGSNEWPDDVGRVVIGLYQSVNGEDPTPVLNEDIPMTVTLTSEKTFDNTTFDNLPARDENGNDITYSIVQRDLPGYYTSYKVSGTGWYVVRNESAVSVTVTKEWYGLDGQPAAAREDVAFDLYCTTADHPEITTRDGLEAILRGLEPVRTGLTLSADNGWTNTVTSLQKQDAAGNLYYYFALEREDSMPRNNEDSYAVTPADGGNLRTLTVKNTQTPITVIIRADDLTKPYGQDDPEFAFTTEVQDDACSVSQPVQGEGNTYTVTVTDGSGNEEQITFTCSRETGEDVGNYAIKLSGSASQQGYRVRLDDGELTITPAQVTVKGTATKVYGDPDPSLVEITGLKKGDSIAYYAYRDIGEQKGSYRITVTGLTKQGNYEITYINDYLTITPAPVTVTADNISKPYGADDPDLTVTIDGLKNQDATSVIKYTISRDKQGTGEGESVGEYAITVTGGETQGNYTVTFVPGTFTITGHKVTVRAKNMIKTYGDSDPTWEAEVTGLNEGETLTYTFTRVEGEDVGTYVVTPVGETKQGNAEVIYETGILTINRASMTVTPVNIIKALTEPITPDPQLTVTFDGLAERDKEIEPTAVFEAGTWTYTYTREDKTEPEFSFTITRTPGETAGPYIIAASAYGERPKNYNITYKTGIFTILTTYNVVLTQQTRDLVDYTQNPEYSYKAVLDPEAIGIETYNAGGFVNNEMTFTLPADGSSSKTLPIPSGAKLTVTQETTNPDYTTAITLDTKDVEGTSVEIEKVNKAASIIVTHERIALPVEARAAQSQTDDGKAVEDGAVAVTPLAYLGIPRAEQEPHDPVVQSAEAFIAELDGQGVYNLPEDMYYVPEHASVYNGDTAVATDIQAIRYDEENKVWKYSTDGSAFTSFDSGDQLELFYMPKYICRVDSESFYTLNDALEYIDDITPDGVDAEGKTIKFGSGTIEMFIDYTLPAADALTIPANFNITLTSAEGTKTILRKPSNLDHMISNSGTLTLDSIVIDGNRARVTANNAMVLNNGTLTVGGAATLKNASGNNGGAIYANSGSVTVEAGATFTGNSAVNGGAIYFRDGSLSIATENVSGNTAVNGGAVYMAGGKLQTTGSLSGNTAVNGGAVYMAGGTLNTSGAINSNEATTGGAVFMTDGTLNLTDGTVGSNNAANGGAFYLTGGKLNMSGGTVSGNTATENGGAFYSSNTTVSITGGSITGNSAASGGAILLESGKASVGGTAVQGNSASNFGGAVCQTGGTLTVTGTIDGANTAKNGSAVYVQNGSATFDGCNITENTATAGGAIGVGSTEARLHFTGNAKVTGNTWNGEAGNLYLDQDSDLVINTIGLDEYANIGVRVKDDLLSTRGDVASKFGTYTVDKNLSGFKNDVNTGLVACADNYKIIWSKPITVNVIKLNSYATTFPPSDTTAATTTFSYNPKSQTNSIYNLVMEMYNAVYKSNITGDDLYAYSFASTATDFSQFLSAINWDSENQRWDFVEHSGNKATGNPNLKIYYSNGAYISIVNNSAYDLTVDSMSVLGKDVPFYGYPTVKNNITLETLTPVTAEDLVLKSGENIKLLFPGAVNRNWTLTGTFTDPTTHEPVPNASYEYTLGRNDGGQKQSGTANGQGKITHSGKTKKAIGGSYEILFGNPTNICKVTDGGVEHPFPTLNDAWNYIIDNGLTYTYTKEDDTSVTMPGGTIEMLIDYLQPFDDVLKINEASFTSRGKSYSGYCLKLTTAATSGVQYPYVGQTGVTRATISRDSDNDGAAVIAMPYKATKAATEAECDAFLIVDNLTFDGKALAKKGNGGAISTANNVVTITRCDFKGYQAVRGGAVFVAWGALTVGGDNPKERCTFSNCSTGDSSGDKIGGGGIWTSAQNLVVKNADFDTCACIIGNSQGGAIFHNIRPGTGTVGKEDDKKSIYTGGDSGEYAIFPEGYSLTSTTLIEDCTFKNCYSVGGSGGTIECDSMVVEIDGCLFDGSYSNKSNANGGAVNILHNDSFGFATVYPDASLTVIDSTFNNCQTNTGASYGGAICDQNSVKTKIINCYFNNCSSNRGGAIVTNREKKIPTDITDVLPNGITVSILGSRFEDCTARTEGGAVHTTTTKLTISDTYKNDNGQDVTAEAWFKNCSAPSYGGVYQDGYVAGSEVTVNNVYFDSCSSNTGNAGALMVNAQTLSITGTARKNEKDPYTFTACTAGGSGGAVYHSPKTTVKDTLTNVSFYNCSAKAEGGGARLASTAIEISGAEVRNCEAVTNGGGIYVSGATTIEDCVFSDNKATGETGNGGSIYFNSGTSAITGGSISDSIAVNGGGIYNKGTLTISKGTEENSGTITNCAARTSGGGIYATGAVTLSDAVISDCYAVTSGGGIYHTGNLYPYGTVTKCYAGQGGGLYSNGYLAMTDTAQTVEISDCHAATVTVAENGTASAEKQYLPDNLGGGIYKGSTNKWDLKSDTATVSGCSAYDGGGVYYNTTGTLTYTAGNFYNNTAINNGGAIYKNGTGSVTMSGGVIGGSAENANHAQYGSAIFVADGRNITLGGGRITHNVAEAGGAVAAGGTNTQLLFQGAPVIRNNTNTNGVKCNVYLNYDTNGIIRTSGALTGGAYIGVYVTDEQFARHGDYTLPFGTYGNASGLGSFFNDRIYAGGKQGNTSTKEIVWGEFVCKITDGDGNLLYTDPTCEAPAVYITLENDGAANYSSAYGTLQNANPALYKDGVSYSGSYQIQMLVPMYTTVKRLGSPTGVTPKNITLTTADPDATDGFPYTGDRDNPHAIITRGSGFANAWFTVRDNLTVTNITLDGNNIVSTEMGGTFAIKNGGVATLGKNAEIKNSKSSNHGGAVALYNSGTNRFYLAGGTISNSGCSGKNGGAIFIENAVSEFHMSDGLITDCSAGNGGAVYGAGKIYMSGGEISGCSATNAGGAIAFSATGARAYFSGTVTILGNTKNGDRNNVELNQDKNDVIHDAGLEPLAVIGVYTAGSQTNTSSMRYKHGIQGAKFGTWDNEPKNVHVFVNDRQPELRGYRNSKNAGDYLICWDINPVLQLTKLVDSDWSLDRNRIYTFEVRLIAQDDSTSMLPITYGDMTFNYDGDAERTLVATVTLTNGQTKTASAMPYEFLHKVDYTITEIFSEGVNPYDTTYQQTVNNSIVPDAGVTVTGSLGENMNADPLLSSSASSVIFTNTRATDDLTVSKTVTEGITGDYTMPFTFTVTLDDDTISKTYNAKHYQDVTDTTGTDETVTFTEGVATFQLTHGQSMKIIGLPTELGFKVEEKLTQDQYANFRAYVTAGSAEETLSYSATGTIGVLKNVAFRNNRYGLVCKIVNDTAGREQLYYRDNNNPNADPTPAIFDELEKAFETINSKIEFFTADGQNADSKLRIEMVKPRYVMNRQATLNKGYNVTLGTAKKTDPLYPYPTDADGFAVVTRGYDGGSMIADYGNLTIDNITLDGNSDNYTAGTTELEKEDLTTVIAGGGIVQVNGAQTLTVTENATLRNSKSSGNGGAIWLNEKTALVMNGTITGCEAVEGGGVYANDGFGGGRTQDVGVTIGGTISECKAAAGNGGALYVGTAASILGGAPVILTGSAKLSGNQAVIADGVDNSGRGGALYCATDVVIDSDNVTISDNTAEKDGGGIYQSADSGSFNMTGGTISNNTAETGNAGGIRVNHITITGGEFSGNKANGKTVTGEGGAQTVENGKGGAIYTKTTSEVSITGTTFEGNEAYQGGAVYDQAASFTVTDVTMSENSAVKNGGAVYVSSIATNNDGSAKTGPFKMIGGIISGNSSPEGAISTGSGAVLNFSGNVEVFGNTADDGTTNMNVYLGYHSNAIINASGLTGTNPIGVYVKDGEDSVIYNNHGIANRPFGTGATESEDNLSKFVNDRDTSLKGVRGLGNLIMWPGKDLKIQVYQNKENDQGQKTTPVGGAKFSLSIEKTVTTDDPDNPTTTESIIFWTGESDSNGLVTIPWGITEEKNGNRATFTKKDEDGNVTAVTYILSQQQANKDTVRPAGTWELTIAPDNAAEWNVIEPKDIEGQTLTEVNRTINVEPNKDHYLGETFLLYNDVKPTITFDPNGGILSGKEDSSTRTVVIDFSLTEFSHTYTLEEPNPTRENAVFRVWSTVKNPVEGDGHKEYKLGDERLFYRSTDNDDLTLYALWSTVVCKITDREDNLLYVNGSPAVYMSLKEGFDDFNEALLTYKDGTKATPRKIKMLVPDYEMTQTVELARGKICEFMTAPNTDTDGYKGPDRTCVITRASSFDSGSMLIDNYNLVLRDITLDGAVKDSSNTVKTMEGNGGIVTVRGNSSQLTLATGATLRNADVSGKGGAIYAFGNTIVNVSNGIITGCKAADGGAIYADDAVYEGREPVPATVNISGGEISGNTARAADKEARSGGGAVYAGGTVNFSGGEVKNNKAEAESTLAYGGGLYLTADAKLTMTGGILSGNSAVSGGGVYSDGSVTVSNESAVISGNSASANGGGVYVSESGILSLSAGSVGESGKPNTASGGSGVYLAGKATLTGGSISYNGTETGTGGGLYLNTVEEITLNGTELSHNQAKDGGAIYAVKPESAAENVTLTIAKGSISNNSASVNGGGVYLESGVKLAMTGGALNTNTAANGGGAYAASGSTMTLSGGTVGSTDGKTGNSANNGAGVYVEGNSESTGILRVESGSISGNKATAFGGAVYLQDYGQLYVSGGEISANSADNANGGAINADGVNARIYLSGTPTIFNNPGDAQTTAQKNLVLSEDQNTIINTDEEGLDEKIPNSSTKAAPNVSGIVGIYVIDDYSVYEYHGVYDKPFGTFGITDEKRINAKNLVNDRNLGLYGVDKNDGIIYWKDVVCKITDANDFMLYQRVNVDDSGVYVYAPAVYSSLKEGFDALSGNLYRRSGTRYATANTGAVRLKMLRDYTLGENELITYDHERTVTLMTAETNITDTMTASGDSYVYVRAEGASGENETKATLTRAQSIGSMFTVNLISHNFHVTDLIIDGGNDTMLTPGIDGGAFNFQSVRSSTFTRVTLKNLNATRNGGAIYLNSGSLTLTSTNDDYGDTRVIGSTAVNGGAIYVNSGRLSLTCTSSVKGNTIVNGNTAVYGGAIYLNSGTLTINRHSILTDNTAEQDGGAVYVNAGASATLGNSTLNHNTATRGAGIYLTVNSTLNLNNKPEFGGTDRRGGTGSDKDDLMGNEGNFVLRDASFKTETDKEPTNGSKPYPKDAQGNYLVRQDIYAEGIEEPLDSIHVTGNLTSGNGAIWVWAENVNHYEMLKQFAVYTGNGTVQEATMKVFRNAWPDSETNCGGDYLTGQKGEVANWIYWTGGFDVVFLKTDGFDKPLPGATFTLYSDPACTTPFEMTFNGSTPATGDGKRATTVSSDGTATYKDKNGSIVTLEKGEVLLSKVPPKTFYLKETSPAPGYDSDENKTTVYQVIISDKGELTMNRKRSEDTTYTPVFKELRHREADDLEQYVVMNIPEAERKVILRKTAKDDYKPLQNAKFQIYRFDGTEVINGDYNSTDKAYVSLSNGVYFIDTLPYGTYYLYEKTAPSGYTGGKWFTLTVSNDNANGSRDGVTVAEINDAAHITELQNFVKP